MDAPFDQNEPLENVVHSATWCRKTALTLGILALFLLVAAVSRQRMASQGSLLQHEAADQKAYRDSKANVSMQYQLFLDLFAGNNDLSAEARAVYSTSVVRYRREQAAIDQEVYKLLETTALIDRRVRWLYFGEAFLEIAIVVCTLAILTRRALFWHISLVLGATGAIVSLLALLGI